MEQMFQGVMGMLSEFGALKFFKDLIWILWWISEYVEFSDGRSGLMKLSLNVEARISACQKRSMIEALKMSEVSDPKNMG